MKNCVYLILALMIFFTSCENESYNDDLESQISKSTKTRVADTSLTFDWENTSQINLYNYGEVTLPWCGGAAAPIVLDLENDYKKSQGWELLYNFCTDPKQYEYGKYYLIFYNKLTGILRIYYYDVYDVTQANSSFCKLYFDADNTYFNKSMAADNYIDTLQDKYVTPLAASSVKAINKGWNCFQYRLAYDPNISSINAHFNVCYYDALLANLKLSSDVNLKNKGSIVETSSSNPLSAFISIIGSGASSEIDSLLFKNNTTKNKTILSSMLQQGAETVVSNGVSYLLGNLLSSFSKSSANKYTLEFNTTGTISTLGALTSNFSSNIVSVNNLLIPGGVTENSDNLLPIYNKPLGVWNLATTPIIEIKNGIDYYEERTNNTKGGGKETNIYDCNKKFLLRPSSVHVLLNPAISSEIDSSKIIVRLVTNTNTETSGLNMKGLFYNSTISDYGNTIITPYYGGVKFKVVADADDGDIINNFKDSKPRAWINILKVCVTVMLYPKNKYEVSPVIETRTFTPKFIYVKDFSESYNNRLNDNYPNIWEIIHP